MTSSFDILTAAKERGERILSEYDSKRLLSAYGVPVARESLTTSRAAAIEAATALGFPVALKGCSASVSHKTESGLIELGLSDAKAVGVAFDRIRARLPDGGVLVQEMVPGQRELILGLVRDPQFGPCVSLGIGGIFAEAIGDVVFRVAPFSPAEAVMMMDEIENSALLGSVRGLPAVDRSALADALVALGRLGLDHKEIGEIDINPMIVAGSRPIAVDALIVLS
jgi:succinyl-CoA synthetase beta subunit